MKKKRLSEIRVMLEDYDHHELWMPFVEEIINAVEVDKVLEPERYTEAAEKLFVLLNREHMLGYQEGYRKSAGEGRDNPEFGSMGYSCRNRAEAAEAEVKRLREKIASIEELLRIPDNK